MRFELQCSPWIHVKLTYCLQVEREETLLLLVIALEYGQKSHLPPADQYRNA